MDTKHVKQFEPVVEKSMANPLQVQTIIVEGFQFHIYWDNVREIFVGIMSFTPHWPHTHSVYGKTPYDFMERIENEITESMKIYKNGGNYK